MADVVIFHNPNCSTSNYAVGVADELGVDYDVVKYMLKSERPDCDALTRLVAEIEDPVTDLVRRDANFTKLGLTDADVETAEQVIDVLEANPQLLQRPILVKDGRAIIGRPKTRVPEFLQG
ncbi:MAG: arsenate reductase [Actinomycetota bacterium]|nr:arsenate reductase [Actinomycetota bacterium]